ncbi:MAG: ABC transporter ATP-binding protein [Chloroflexota bacterium]
MSAISPLTSGQARGGVTLRQLWSIVEAWRWVLVLIAAVVLLGAALELVPPLLIRQIVDQHLAVGQREGLLLLALLYLGATAAVQAMGFLTEFLMAVTAQNALHRLRRLLFAHLQTLPLSYYDRTPLGDTISRCTADVETVATLFSQTATAGAGGGGGAGGAGGGAAAGGAPGAGVLTGVVRLFTVGVALVVLIPGLALISALVVPPLVMVTRAFQVRVRDAERANRTAVGLQNTHLQETLGGVEMIRALGREAVFVARFRLALHQGLVAFNRASIYSALYTPLMGILAALVTALILWVGAGGTLASWGVSLGTLTAFVLLFQRFFQPITTLGNQWQTVQAALSGLERIFQVLALSPEEFLPSSPRAVSGTTGEAIELRDVVFGYLPDQPVLNGISLVVRPGEHVALVGRTGAGKTSTLHLLGGLYTTWAGTVRVSGIDPRTLAEKERRRLIGFVPQVVQLFSGTVLENLTLGDASVSGDAVRQAAAIAGADSFIRALPQGYDTVLGSSAQLSGGQRQLLTLTRALVWDPAVLLLDEATAAVDSASEAAFRNALRKAIADRGRAVLTVAHRLSTAREADRVVVMEKGRIVEQGHPEELMLRGGWFAAMLELEEAGWT